MILFGRPWQISRRMFICCGVSEAKPRASAAASPASGLSISKPSGSTVSPAQIRLKASTIFARGRSLPT